MAIEERRVVAGDPAGCGPRWTVCGHVFAYSSYSVRFGRKAPAMGGQPPSAGFVCAFAFGLEP
jgi:hypothetical protein